MNSDMASQIRWQRPVRRNPELSRGNKDWFDKNDTEIKEQCTAFNNWQCEFRTGQKGKNVMLCEPKFRGEPMEWKTTSWWSQQNCRWLLIRTRIEKFSQPQESSKGLLYPSTNNDVRPVVCKDGTKRKGNLGLALLCYTGQNAKTADARSTIE